MAETLLAVLLVTSSSKGPTIAFHWPPFPATQPRLARPKPQHGREEAPMDSRVDNFWRAAVGHDPSNNADAAFTGDVTLEIGPIYEDPTTDELEYEWKRPSAFRNRQRSRSLADATSRPSSRRPSPSAADISLDADYSHLTPEEAAYDTLLGYPAELLAKTLCTQQAHCHQKFELMVDDLAFIGHPVAAEADGSWKFKEVAKKDAGGRRGRGARGRSDSNREEAGEVATPASSTPRQAASSSLAMFHLVLVLDLPDPSSSASGNLFKYFHIIYEQLAFTFTAVLYQEQVLHGFVDAECEALASLKEEHVNKGRSFSEFVGSSLEKSTLVRAMKTLFESVKANEIARLVIHDIGIELQLPPRLDVLLLHPDEYSIDADEELAHAHSESQAGFDAYHHPDDVHLPRPGLGLLYGLGWGPELSTGWTLPTLAPWKSLLLHDREAAHTELVKAMQRPAGMSEADQALAERLLQFLQAVSIFDSLAVVASSLDWDLEQHVYPTVRWLVYHRRAKVVDSVHRGLKTVFALSDKFDRPLPELTAEFARAFPHASVPPLPSLLTTISNPAASKTNRQSRSDPPESPFNLQSQRQTSTHTRSHSEAHFFATVVRSKDNLMLYQDIVTWLLRNDLLVTLHLHVRIVATPEIKLAVRKRREAERAQRRERRERRRQAELAKEKRRGSVVSMSMNSQEKDLDEKRGSGSRRPSTRSFHDSSTLVNEDDNSGTDVLRQLPHDYPVPSTRERGRRFSSKSARSDLKGQVISEEFASGSVSTSYRGGRQASAYRLPGDGRGGKADNVEDEPTAEEEENEESDDLDGVDDSDIGGAEDNELATIIYEPARATAIQRKWIDQMSEGKDPTVRQRFEQINQYFDGKCTDDEILYRAEISRKLLREILHHYEEYLLTFLHPT